MDRQIVLVSGAPGAGKSTIALPLAAALGFPLLAKDDIKETLWDALDGPPGDRAYSRLVGGAAMELLWKLASRCPQVVMEANFRPKSAYERAKITALGGRIVEVYCRCPSEEIARRYADRAASGVRHPAHVLASLTPEHLAEFDRPVGLGPVISVDTTHPVDITALAARVWAAW